MVSHLAGPPCNCELANRTARRCSAAAFVKHIKLIAVFRPLRNATTPVSCFSSAPTLPSCHELRQKQPLGCSQQHRPHNSQGVQKCCNAAATLQTRGLVIFWNLMTSLFYLVLKHNETRKRIKQKKKKKWFIENTDCVVVT